MQPGAPHAGAQEEGFQGTADAKLPIHDTATVQAEAVAAAALAVNQVNFGSCTLQVFATRHHAVVGMHCQAHHSVLDVQGNPAAALIDLLLLATKKKEIGKSFA